MACRAFWFWKYHGKYLAFGYKVANIDQRMPWMGIKTVRSWPQTQNKEQLEKKSKWDGKVLLW
jgi:hypothetical protein